MLCMFVLEIVLDSLFLFFLKDLQIHIEHWQKSQLPQIVRVLASLAGVPVAPDCRVLLQLYTRDTWEEDPSGDSYLHQIGRGHFLDG